MASWLDNLFGTVMRGTKPDNTALGFRAPTEEEMKANVFMQRALAGQANKQDATQGELGIIMHPDNRTWSHEVSTTIPNPAGKGWVNVPLLTQNQDPNAILRILFGQPQPQDFRAAASRAAERVQGGATLPTYRTAKRADRAAMKREVAWTK